MHKQLHTFKYLPINPDQKDSGNNTEPHVTDRLFKKLKQKAFASRPQLKKTLEEHGDLTLYEFSKIYNRSNNSPAIEDRRKQFIEIFTDEVKRLLGDEIAQSCAKQLASTYRVTTTDHHGPLSEPGMVNSNIHEALPYLDGDDTVKNVMVLGCANVSFDNASFPRGLIFHSNGNNTLAKNQLVFYPRSVRPCPVIFYPAYTAENMANAKNRIEAWEREHVITKNNRQKIEQLLDEVYADPSVLSCKYFSEQVTKTNFKLWKNIMKAHKKAPNLVYIEQEYIVNALLQKYHLNQKTLINKLLFTPEYHDLILKHFDGIIRGFSTKEKQGTYLFWALPNGQKYRVQLWKKGNFLETEDGSYKIELTPEGIGNALAKKELIPSTLMSFIILSFYYGVRLVGGFNQTTYLTVMKEAFIKMQKEYGDEESVSFVNQVETTDLSVLVQSLAFLQTPQEARVPGTGTDYVLYGNPASFSIMKQIANTLTLKETFYRALPDYEKWYAREQDHDPELAHITKEAMEKYLRIEQKIFPSAKISSE